nr:uncharacterized protein LOC109178743 [Ipomoea trifida]
MRFCFVDAGIQDLNNTAAFSFYIQNGDGSFVVAVNGPLACLQDPALVEVMAVRETLSWMKEHGFSDVIVFLDCQFLCVNLHHKVIARSYVGHVVLSYLQLISSTSGCFVSFISRHANQAAHFLAKAEGATTIRSVW